LLGSLGWHRFDLSSIAIDLGESVCGEVCMADGPNQSALVIDDRDAFDERRPKHEVRCLQGRAGLDDDGVGGHHVRD
jgi:hypothetical protein